jgi:hypothetical protein
MELSPAQHIVAFCWRTTKSRAFARSYAIIVVLWEVVVHRRSGCRSMPQSHDALSYDRTGHLSALRLQPSSAPGFWYPSLANHI